MTVQTKQRVQVVRVQGEERRAARGGRAAARLAALAVPFWLMACGSSPQGSEGSEPRTGTEPSLPGTRSGSNMGSAPGAVAGAVEATPATTSEQPNPAPML